MSRDCRYYFCGVGPLAGGDVFLSPGVTYRLNLNGSALRAPARDGLEQHAVATDSELEELRHRGFSVTTFQGPFSTQLQAENSLDGCWEDPS